MDRKRNQNQRRHPRRAAFIIVEYTVNEGVFRDILKSIGASGMFVSTQRNIAPGQSIVLKFPLFQFEHLIHASGQVVRSGHTGFAVTFDQPISDLICDDGQLPEIVHEINRS